MLQSSHGMETGVKVISPLMCILPVINSIHNYRVIVTQNVARSAGGTVLSASFAIRSASGHVFPATDASHDAADVYANERQSSVQSAAAVLHSSADSAAALYGQGLYANNVITACVCAVITQLLCAHTVQKH